MSGFDATPQFTKAEYLGEPTVDHCASCSQPIAGVYYRVNDATTCPACAVRARTVLHKQSHATYLRALLFGCGGAVLGLILYSAFGIITGLVIGYLSLAVGYIVGKAMMMGSRGVGGRRYQVTAVILTYAAVSLSAVPIGISTYVKQRNARQQKVAEQKQAASEQRSKLDEEQKQFGQEFGQQYTAPIPKSSLDAKHKSSSQARTTEPPQSPAAEPPQASALPPQAPPVPARRPNIGAALGYFLMIGLASPFLEFQSPLSGLIGLIILLVGIQIAWRITAAKEPEISGPFRSTAPPAPSL